MQRQIDDLNNSFAKHKEELAKMKQDIAKNKSKKSPMDTDVKRVQDQTMLNFKALKTLDSKMVDYSKKLQKPMESLNTRLKRCEESTEKLKNNLEETSKRFIVAENKLSQYHALYNCSNEKMNEFDKSLKDWNAKLTKEFGDSFNQLKIESCFNIFFI